MITYIFKFIYIYIYLQIQLVGGRYDRYYLYLPLSLAGSQYPQGIPICCLNFVNLLRGGASAAWLSATTVRQGWVAFA